MSPGKLVKGGIFTCDGIGNNHFILSIIIKDKSMKSESDSNTLRSCSSIRMEHPFIQTRPDGLMCLPAQRQECGGVPRRQASPAGEEDRCIRITRVI